MRKTFSFLKLFYPKYLQGSYLLSKIASIYWEYFLLIEKLTNFNTNDIYEQNNRARIQI